MVKIDFKAVAFYVLFSVTMVFIAHALPVSTWLERKIISEKTWSWWVLLFLYYAVLLVPPSIAFDIYKTNHRI